MLKMRLLLVQSLRLYILDGALLFLCRVPSYTLNPFPHSVTDVCSAGARSSSVKNVRIGDVPDRGGRVSELNLTKGAADMPLWAARKQARKTEKAAAASASVSGGAGEAISSQNKDERARALLAEASKFEGEAGAALAEHEEDMAVEAAEQALNTRKQTWSARGGSHGKR